jgi:F-type H+-transporting ATPase subunit delta
MLSESIAERYAQALFQAARDKGQIKEWERHLEHIGESVKSHPFLGKVFLSPQIAEDVKKDILRKVFSKECPPELLNFLCILVDKGRECYLESISDNYAHKVQELEGGMTARITVASPLTRQQETGLIKALSGFSGKKVKIETSIDPAIIGGLVIRMEDRILDWSIAGHLEHIRDRMIRATA